MFATAVLQLQCKFTHCSILVRTTSTCSRLTHVLFFMYMYIQCLHITNRIATALRFVLQLCSSTKYVSPHSGVSYHDK